MFLNWMRRHASKQELHGGNHGEINTSKSTRNMQKLFDCIRPLLKRFLACLTFHRKKIRLRHLRKRTNPGSAPENACNDVLLSTVVGMKAYSFRKRSVHHRCFLVKLVFTVLRNIIFRENCWSTASDFKEHFGCIVCFISNKLTNCLAMFTLEIFNQNIAKLKSNI